MNEGMLMFPLRPWHFVLLPPPLGPDQNGEAKGSRTVSMCYPDKQDIPSSCPAQALLPRVGIAEGGGVGQLSSHGFVYF